MPYITTDKRDILDPKIDELHQLLVGLELDEDKNNMEGNVNYIITKLLLKVYPASNYGEINDVMGVLNCVTHEYYRRAAAPYENQKVFENTDVFPSGTIL